jgi:hypothetical protein
MMGVVSQISKLQTNLLMSPLTELWTKAVGVVDEPVEPIWRARTTVRRCIYIFVDSCALPLGTILRELAWSAPESTYVSLLGQT